jgi:hypothetical protein
MEPPGRQPTVQTRIDQRCKVFGVEYLARNRNNGITRNELLSGQRRVCIAANKVKNLLPLWIGDRGTPRWWNKEMSLPRS